MQLLLAVPITLALIEWRRHLLRNVGLLVWLHLLDEKEFYEGLSEQERALYQRRQMNGLIL